MCEEENPNVEIMKALEKAKEAYYKHFEEQEIDAAYYPLLKLEAGRSGESFESLLDKIVLELDVNSHKKGR